MGSRHSRSGKFYVRWGSSGFQDIQYYIKVSLPHYSSVETVVIRISLKNVSSCEPADHETVSALNPHTGIEIATVNQATSRQYGCILMVTLYIHMYCVTSQVYM